MSTETANNENEPEKERETLGEVATTFLIAIIIILMFRAFLFEPFNIPSTSMVPTLKVGDYLFVSKSSYGYSRYSFPFGIGGFDGRIMRDTPERGDVIVFKLPTNTSQDYIKRLVGLSGDTIQMINGRLYINDVVVPRELVGMTEYQKESGVTAKVFEYIETLPNGAKHHIFEDSDREALDDTEKFTVPDGHYFLMGDNRDNSRDSRVPDLVGYVPEDHLVGRAEFLFFSTNGTAKIFEVWKWPWTIRYDRLFMGIGNGNSLKDNNE